MTGGVVISDAGPIFSLAVIDKLEILNEIFKEVYIPNAVWEELSRDVETKVYGIIKAYLKDKIMTIKSSNELTFVMDYGESEAVILYKELDAQFLLIDDRKARAIAENFGLQCIGTIGILAQAKERGLIAELRSYFKILLENNRYYSVALLNAILNKYNEDELD